MQPKPLFAYPLFFYQGWGCRSRKYTPQVAPVFLELAVCSGEVHVHMRNSSATPDLGRCQSSWARIWKSFMCETRFSWVESAVYFETGLIWWNVKSDSSSTLAFQDVEYAWTRWKSNCEKMYWLRNETTPLTWIVRTPSSQCNLSRNLGYVTWNLFFLNDHALMFTHSISSDFHLLTYWCYNIWC